MFMQVDTPPFNDDLVRRAFKLIGDRVAMTQIAWPEFPARPEDDNPVIPPSPFRIDTSIWRQDLQQARRLIEEAGHGAGLEVTLWAISDLPGVVDFSLAFAGWAKEIGVTINVEPIKADIYYAEKWLQVPFGTVSWSPRTTVDEQLRVAYTTGAKWNETHFSDTELDRLLDEALAETDRSRRAALYADIQRRLITDGGQIIPYHYPIAAAHAANVRGFRVHPLNELEARDVWLAE
jgi:peptide/nickel transport system substrate-binding protein